MNVQEGIQPMWEDERNKLGGRWLVNLDKRKRGAELDRFWLETVSITSAMISLTVSVGVDECLLLVYMITAFTVCRLQYGLSRLLPNPTCVLLYAPQHASCTKIY